MSSEDAEPAGADLVREALDRARADGAARRGGRSAPAGRRAAAGRGSATSRAGGDPVGLGGAIEALVDARGWRRDTEAGSVFTRWEELVGEEVARHAKPVALVDGELTVRAESTAWATQLRLLAPRLLEAVRAGTGPDSVTRLKVQAPTTASWSRGALRVKGRGPRDTYG